ncbi:MAG TPA: phosphatase PAP2 family protein [Solirubrobacteraceae bacterium]|nr:phosphatase PAP2 family protein [Solirubrobacteraceae bacterium]
MARASSGANLDERLLRVARTHGHTPAADRLVARFSLLGEHAGVWLLIGAVGTALDRERRGEWRRATATVAGVYALNTAIKLVVRRRRPELAGLPPITRTPTTLSFPSAHASAAFAGARLYSRLGLPAVPLYALATGLALSRLYLGVHYPSDVLAGAALGAAAASTHARNRPTPTALRQEARRLASDPADRSELAELRDELDGLTPPWPAD